MREATGKRNVLVVLCDQLRPDFLSLYGCNAIPTPNLERLAAHGVVFDRAITASTVCAPARASMMTGRHVSDHGVWSNGVPFRPGMELVADRMAAEGYRTGAFGKLHHYPDRDVKGFQVARLMEEGRLGDDDDYLRFLKQKHPELRDIFNDSDGVFGLDEEDYYEHWIASEAIAFIGRDAGSEEQPFFAWVSFQGPHTPMDPPACVKGSVRADALPAVVQFEEDMPEVARYRACHQPPPVDPLRYRTEYGEMIVYIDRQIGRIIEHLETIGLWESTTVIFGSDHGDLCGDHRMSYKGPHPYQGQLSIPLLVANDPRVQPGTRSSQLASNLDIPGTALDVADADRLIGQSRSLLNLACAYPVNPREVNLSEFGDSIRTVENERYRFSYYPFSQEVELFDLLGDPQCTRNLAGTLPDVENSMLKHLVDFSICNRQVRIEAGDLVPGVQDGLARKHPLYLDDYRIYWRMSAEARRRLEAHGLPGDFDHVLDGRPEVKKRGG